MQGADVGVIQAGNNFRLPLETLTAGRVVGEMRRKNLDGNGAVQARIQCAIDFSHSTRAQRSDDLIRTQSGAVRQRHGCSGL
jgi:hypothetical protein